MLPGCRHLLRFENPDRPSVDIRASAVRPSSSLFASLTLRAARNYLRYSATLRSYSDFE